MRSRPLAIDNLELHVAHSCNLACESCSHYSNHGHKGLLDLDEARRGMEPWAGRLVPARFSLLGGEPTIHPDLAEFVPLARALWPRSKVRIATNGLLLHRHPDLPRRLAAAGNAVLEISIHHASDEYRHRLEPVFDLLRRWVRRYGINIGLVHSYANWTRRYKGFGAAMAPHEDDDPRLSWEHCPPNIAHNCSTARSSNAGRSPICRCRMRNIGSRSGGGPISITGRLPPAAPTQRWPNFSRARRSRSARCVLQRRSVSRCRRHCVRKCPSGRPEQRRRPDRRRSRSGRLAIDCRLAVRCPGAHRRW